MCGLFCSIWVLFGVEMSKTNEKSSDYLDHSFFFKKVETFDEWSFPGQLHEQGHKIYEKTFESEIFKGDFPSIHLALGLNDPEDTKEVKSDSYQEKNDHSIKQDEEKLETLRSLKDFTLSKGEKDNQSRVVFPFKGGSVHLKEDNSFEAIHHIELKEASEGLPVFKCFEDFDQKSHSTPLKVAFLGDIVHEDKEDLLHKMISAMRLNEGDYVRGPIDKDNTEDSNFKKNILSELLVLKPQVVISLGAQATHFLLKSEHRLSRVHGKFHEVKIAATKESAAIEFQTSVVPIFHPDFLRINPNMKKTAWIDLQKVMQFLKL